MYQADFHYGLTYFLALKAGFSDAQARTIATGAEAPDQDPARAPIGTSVKAIGDEILGALMQGPRGEKKKAEEAELRGRLRADHFPRSDSDPNIVVPFSQESQQRVMKAMQTGDLHAFGEGLHTLQDSMSHRGEPSLRGMSGHPNERGGVLSTDTDVPYKYPRQALVAAQATYNYLVALRNKQSGSASQPTWGEIEAEVNQFIGLEERDEKKGWLRARGVTMPDTYWDDVSMGRQEWERVNHLAPVTVPQGTPLIDAQTAAAMAKARAQCGCRGY